MKNHAGGDELVFDPFWGLGRIAPEAAEAGAIIDGGLAEDVGGLGAYAMWDNHLYGAAAVYRSAHLGAPQPTNGEGFGVNIRGTAPYWRLAWQQSAGNNYLEVGTYGLHVSSSPNTIIGPTDENTDVAADLQYERVLPTLGNDMITAHSTYIHESSTLNASFGAGAASNLQDNLSTFRADGTFHFGNKYAATGEGSSGRAFKSDVRRSSRIAPQRFRGSQSGVYSAVAEASVEGNRDSQTGGLIRRYFFAQGGVSHVFFRKGT